MRLCSSLETSRFDGATAANVKLEAQGERLGFNDVPQLFIILAFYIFVIHSHKASFGPLLARVCVHP